MARGITNPGQYREDRDELPMARPIIHHTAEGEGFDDLDDRDGRPNIGQSLEQQSELLKLLEDMIDKLGAVISPVLKEDDRKSPGDGGVPGGTSSVGDRLLSHNASINELMGKLRTLTYRVDL